MIGIRNYSAVYIIKCLARSLSDSLVVSMSRLSVILSLTGVALSASPVDFRSPLRYDTEGRLIANIFVSSSSGQSIPVRLDAWQNFAISQGLLSHRSISATVDFLMIGDPYQSFSLVAPSPSALRDPSHSYMGIGPNSFITREVGSVAVVRNGSHPELILRSTPDHFRTSCMPDSLMTFDANRYISVAPTLRSDSMESSFGTYEIRFMKCFLHRAYVPQLMFGSIRERLLSLGFVYEEGFQYSNCTQSGMATLPNIDFTFSTGDSIVFLPEDYVDFDDSDNTCQLRVAAAPAGQILLIDPLMLVDTNVRVSRDNIWEFCDAAAAL
jgi:hypothetical protein